MFDIEDLHHLLEGLGIAQDLTILVSVLVFQGSMVGILSSLDVSHRYG